MQIFHSQTAGIQSHITTELSIQWTLINFPICQVECPMIVTMQLAKKVRKMRKYLWLRQPMQLLRKTQWWSNLSTHLLQKLQWAAVSGLKFSQQTQMKLSSRFSSSSRYSRPKKFRCFGTQPGLISVKQYMRIATMKQSATKMSRKCLPKSL